MSDAVAVAGEDYAGVFDEVRDDGFGEPATVEILEVEWEVLCGVSVVRDAGLLLSKFRSF